MNLGSSSLSDLCQWLQHKIQVFFLYQFRVYAKTTFLYQFRMYANSTCVHALIAMEIFHYMRGCKSPARRVSDMDAIFSCILNLYDVRMRISITCIVPRGCLWESSLKKSVSGGSFIRGKSVEEEDISCRTCL